MNLQQEQTKVYIQKVIAECRETFPLTFQELLEVVISCAGDLAAEERRLLFRATDLLPCGHSSGKVFGETCWNCAVCGEPVPRSRPPA